MMLPPPKKKAWFKRPWGIALIIFLALGVCGGINNAVHGANTTTSATPNTANNVATSVSTPVFSGSTPMPTYSPTPKPTDPPAPTWKTTHTFTGNGTKKTDSFTVADTWKIVWKCDPTSFGGYNFNLIVSVTATDGSLGDPAAVNTLCSPTNTHDTTTEHTGGNVYLDVNSEGRWTLEVQELQ